MTEKDERDKAEAGREEGCPCFADRRAHSCFAKMRDERDHAFIENARLREEVARLKGEAVSERQEWRKAYRRVRAERDEARERVKKGNVAMINQVFDTETVPLALAREAAGLLKGVIDSDDSLWLPLAGSIIAFFKAHPELLPKEAVKS